jgi:hypothetical protein
VHAMRSPRSSSLRASVAKMEEAGFERLVGISSPQIGYELMRRLQVSQHTDRYCPLLRTRRDSRRKA